MSVPRSVFLIQAHNDNWRVVARSYEEALKFWRKKYAQDNGTKEVGEPDRIVRLGDALEAGR